MKLVLLYVAWIAGHVFFGMPLGLYIFGLGTILGWQIVNYRHMERKLRKPRIIHPEMLDPNMSLAQRIIIAKAMNTGRPMLGRMDGEGRLEMTELPFSLEYDQDKQEISIVENEAMSLKAHPHFHAVRFVVGIMEKLWRENDLPTYTEVEHAYRQALRGKATPQTDINFQEMTEAFLAVAHDRLVNGSKEEAVDLTVRYVCEVSSRLDEVLDGNVDQD